MKRVITVSVETRIEINSCFIRKQNMKISSFINYKKSYQDTSTKEKIIDFGRCKEGIILPNGTSVYCPGVSRDGLNLLYSGRWVRRSKNGFCQIRNDLEEHGNAYKSLANTIDDILHDYKKGNMDWLPRRLSNKFGSLSGINKNQVCYSVFNGVSVEIKYIKGGKETLDRIHKEEQAFYVEYLKHTSHLLRTNPSAVGKSLPPRDGLILQ